MPHRDARFLTLLLATAGVCLTATGAEAQSGRYMTWANRPASSVPATLGAALSSPAAPPVDARDPAGPPRHRNDLIPRRVAPSQGPARPMMQTAAAVTPTSRGLTPASAWLGSRVAPAFAPGAPDAIPYAASEMAAAPGPAPVPAPAPTPAAYAPPSVPVHAPQPVERTVAEPLAPRRDAPIFNLQRPAPPVHAAPPSDPAPSDPEQVQAAADPMAPRRNARIFQLQPQPAAPPAPAQQQADLTAAPPPPAQAGQSRSRYYSVHRDAGRQPDRPVLPDPVYFDSVTVDLAEPPATEPLVRDAQGRRRVIANVDPNQQ